MYGAMSLVHTKRDVIIPRLTFLTISGLPLLTFLKDAFLKKVSQSHDFDFFYF